MRRPLCLLAALLLTPLAPARGDPDAHRLDTIREDVRRLPEAEPPASPPTAASVSSEKVEHRKRKRDHDDSWWQDDEDGSLAKLCLIGGAFAVTSPIWVPMMAIGDSWEYTSHFQRYPYQVTHGSVVRSDGYPGDPASYAILAAELDDGPRWLRQGPAEPRLRRWSARVAAEYAGQLDDLHRVGGRLLLSTASRFGLDTEMSWFEERLSDGGRDRLWLGDGNLVFRFAQSDRMEWRVGLGFNWLDDPRRTDYGFNFTYGVDWYPRRPWVVSSEIDWGTLGRASLFRFRTTTGVVIWGMESYVGYEYLDIGRTQMNNLIGGVRLWF